MTSIKKTDYNTIFELKKLLVDTIKAEKYDISLQASNVLAYISNNETLANMFESKLKEYDKLKQNNKELLNKTNKFIYEYIRALLKETAKEDYKEIYKFSNYQWHCHYRLEFEYIDFLDTLYKYDEKYKNYAIFNGVVEYIRNCIANYEIDNNEIVVFDSEDECNKYISAKKHKEIGFFRKDIQPLYDYYYLEQKDKENINGKFNTYSESILLKVAIIKVLNDFIQEITTKGMTKKEINNLKTRNNKGELTDREFEIFEYIRKEMPSIKEIAELFKIAENTVNTHLIHISGKLDLEETGLKAIKKYIRKLSYV